MRQPQHAVAKKLGVTVQLISQWERDKQPIPHNRIVPLSKVLKFDFERLNEIVAQNFVDDLYDATHRSAK